MGGFDLFYKDTWSDSDFHHVLWRQNVNVLMTEGKGFYNHNGKSTQAKEELNKANWGMKFEEEFTYFKEK